MRTLVLNAGYEPMQLISWQRALCLVLSAKAELVAEYGEAVRSVSRRFPLPSVVRLTRYVTYVRHFGLLKCTRRNVFLRDQYQCQYCGVRCSPALATLDHVVPRSKGGRTSWDNVVTCCHACNRHKGDKSPKEMSMRLLRVPRRPHWTDVLEDQENPYHNSWLPYLGFVA